MTTAPFETALPPAAAAPPSGPARDVFWFGHSHRIVGGQPDSRYGWWQRPDGPCIVKAMDPGLTAYAQDWLAHERKMLARLHALKVRVPRLVKDGPDHWLVTRFEGLSLERLGRAGGAVRGDALQPLPPLEQLSVWVHLLESLDQMARHGVLATDIYAPNVLLPLTDTTRGQFRLTEPVLIDHAHTLEAGSNLQRPSLIGDMTRMAPELRDLLRQDIAAARQSLLEAGADLPTAESATPQVMAHRRCAWLGYRQRQALQTALDEGRIHAGPAMQFAVGFALRNLLPALSGQAALQGVVQRMTAHDRRQRYPTPMDAAAALRAAVDRLPLVSEQQCRGIGPRDLTVPDRPQRPAAAEPAPERDPGPPPHCESPQTSPDRRPRPDPAPDIPLPAPGPAPTRRQRGQGRAGPQHAPGLSVRAKLWLGALAGAVGGSVGTLLPPGLAMAWWTALTPWLR